MKHKHVLKHASDSFVCVWNFNVAYLFVSKTHAMHLSLAKATMYSLSKSALVCKFHIRKNTKNLNALTLFFH